MPHPLAWMLVPFAVWLAPQDPPSPPLPAPAPAPAPLPTPAAKPVVYVLVVNAGNKVDLDEAAARQLVRKLFLKDLTQWPDGSEARPYQREGSSAPQEAFVKRVLDMSAAELARHWMRLKNGNGTTPPKEVDTDRMVLKYVARHLGAFGVVPLDAVKDVAGVRVLFRF